MTLHLKIRRGFCGTWSVHGLSPMPVSQLPSLSASVDYARRECAAASAVVEVIVDELRLTYFQDAGWPQRIVASATATRRTGRWSRVFDWLKGLTHPNPATGEASRRTIAPLLADNSAVHGPMFTQIFIQTPQV
jgi:hypothetical protein